MMTKTTTTTKANIADMLAAMQAEIAALKAQNAELAAAKASRRPSLTLKVSEKGAVSLYGMGRFPVTLYAAQWEQILGMGDQIKTFIANNESSITRK